MRRLVKFFSLAVVAMIGLLLVSAALVYVHAQIFPFAIETRIRGALFRRLLIRPAVADGWGALLTRVEPLDERHAAIGIATRIAMLRRDGDRIDQCGEIDGVGIVHDLTHQGHILYAAKGAESLAWYDVADPCAPRLLGNIMFGGYGFGLLIRDDRLYLADRSGGMAVFRLDEDGTPTFERIPFGNNVLFDEPSADWMTSDVDALGRWVVAVDGNRGLVVFDPDAPIGQDVRPQLEEFLVRPIQERNIDPAPLRIKTRGEYAYLAMRDRGVAVVHHESDGRFEQVHTIAFDDGECLDVAIAADTLYAASTRGRVYAFDLAADPELRGPPELTYDLGGERSVHSLAVSGDFLYVSAIGSGLFGFRTGNESPVFRWRPPAAVRGIAKVGDRYVAALGTGGFAVLEGDGPELTVASRHALPSFAFGALALDDGTFALSADVAGTFIYRMNPDGSVAEALRIPTPEHVFSAAFIPPDRLATANGVFGLLRYRLELGDTPSARREGDPPERNEGYSMNVAAWQGGFLAGNIAGRLMTDYPSWLETIERVPARCLRMASSADGSEFAAACNGNRIVLWSRSEDGGIDERTFRHNREIASVRPAPPWLIVGGFPGGVSVYRTDGRSERLIADLETAGTPYDILPDDDRFWIAGGTGGVMLLTRDDGGWSLRPVIPVDRLAPRNDPIVVHAERPGT